ncbi:hypothetical protein COU78_04215 [Candidatus Peregrinibacteria bacterium CG10_big_fil_rev_8_21_14_0_10_49_24]|nr:MAG: hypothetical protein COV83_00750 [Candidatus Peregrinibacteria bacterium CG11_big_fil_rev_8_21_14_0_20_49_14]PIR50872.1 MAG: hypothetical protein COU78_04215 [Candidatus Peregrinibacteria bacterium CG10_big_fil_rev_8_21_14_0_10_49_24]PJA67149.1 MAG: hypothetical protein CO157_06145 [Candidatus Peregrinibacteria bacterium CG_4_9_14_3_um_filter_49_12]
MKKYLHSPWFPISLAIAGLIVGYGTVALRQGTAFAALECPAAKQICKDGDCGASPECASGECSANCPGNCGTHNS